MGSFDPKSFSANPDGQVGSGVSWLHDELLKRATERREWLMERIARGVPLPEYKQMVGKCEELRRLINTDIPELFADFYQSDSEDAEDDV